MKKLVMILGICGLAAASTNLSQAAEVGGVVAWHDDFDMGVGARAVFPVEAINERVSGSGEFLFFFPDDGGGSVDVTYWEINANMLYDFPLPSSPISPYLGGGLNVARASVSIDVPANPFITDTSVSETDIGLNLLGGASFENNSSVSPFVEGRIELGGGEGFVLSFGATMSFGGNDSDQP